MANNQQNYEEQIKKGMKNLQMLQESRKRECTHKPSVGAKVIPIHESNKHVPNKKELPESTVICTRCDAYFEATSYSAKELESALYMLTSVAHQIKLNANLSEEDKAELEKYFEALDVVAGFVPYYTNMVDKLSNGGGNRKAKPRVTKGHMGLDGASFGGRGY